MTIDHCVKQEVHCNVCTSHVIKAPMEMGIARLLKVPTVLVQWNGGGGLCLTIQCDC